jgi:hypothetical protein
MKDLQPHQQRVVDEKIELTDKVEKLHTFIHENPIFGKLEKGDQDLLVKQHQVMYDYSKILSARIDRF